MADSKEIKELTDKVGEMVTEMALMNSNLKRIAELSERHQLELYGNGVKVGLAERMRGIEKRWKIVLAGGGAVLVSFLGALGAWGFNNYFVK